MNTPPAVRRYVCRDCGRLHQGWVARCAGCFKFDLGPAEDDPHGNGQPASESEPSPVARSAPKLVVTQPEEPSAFITRSEPVALCDIDEASYKFCRSNLEPLDRVLGGGIVLGAVVLIGGEPGAGKSTIVMQWIDSLGHRCMFATGEENVAQVGARARRINADSARVSLVAETDIDVILDHARRLKVDVLLVDSIQTMECADASGSAGSVTQVRECTHRLINFAKKPGEERAVIIVGQVVSDGSFAGPKALKHLVDILLELEVGEGAERILTSTKNRYGASHLKGRFVMTATGLEPAPFDANDESTGGGGEGEGGEGGGGGRLPPAEVVTKVRDDWSLMLAHAVRHDYDTHLCPPIDVQLHGCSAEELTRLHGEIESELVRIADRADAIQREILRRGT